MCPTTISLRTSLQKTDSLRDQLGDRHNRSTRIIVKGVSDSSSSSKSSITSFQHSSSHSDGSMQLLFPISFQDIENGIKIVLFPVIPKSFVQFTKFLFWHSIITTSTTPLSRLLSKTKSWYGKLIIPTILNFLGISNMIFGYQLNDTYLAYPLNETTDRAFGPHASFGMLWLFMSYLHICHSHTLQKYIHCKTFARLTSVSFICHMGFSVRSLWIDPMEHHPIIKVFLLDSVIQALGEFVSGVKAAAINNDQTEHQHSMMRCYLYSIEGAGTIRTVGYIMALMNAGPTFCQQKNDGLASNCVRGYVLRLLFIRLLTLYYFGIAAQIGPNKENTERIKTRRWSSYKKEAFRFLLYFTTIYTLLSFFDSAEKLASYTPRLYIISTVYSQVVGLMETDRWSKHITIRLTDLVE